eukprot:c13445_g1_i1.p1 GENE.c13445_g1_i1~~c13445_g1_i1.p1  ORF type:complete len:261 (-),score=72.96 c13445_g1_i1:318-1100(-)
MRRARVDTQLESLGQTTEMAGRRARATAGAFNFTDLEAVANQVAKHKAASNGQSTDNELVEPPIEQLSVEQVREFTTVFRIFDSDNSGFISLGELGSLFRWLGRKASPIQLADMVHQLKLRRKFEKPTEDPEPARRGKSRRNRASLMAGSVVEGGEVVSGDTELSLEEFLELMATMTVLPTSTQIMKQAFEVFASEGSRAMPIEDFHDMMLDYGLPDFTDAEVQQMIADAYDDIHGTTFTEINYHLLIRTMTASDPNSKF